MKAIVLRMLEAVCKWNLRLEYTTKYKCQGRKISNSHFQGLDVRLAALDTASLKV